MQPQLARASRLCLMVLASLMGVGAASVAEAGPAESHIRNVRSRFIQRQGGVFEYFYDIQADINVIDGIGFGTNLTDLNDINVRSMPFGWDVDLLPALTGDFRHTDYAPPGTVIGALPPGSSDNALVFANNSAPGDIQRAPFVFSTEIPPSVVGWEIATGGGPEETDWNDPLGGGRYTDYPAPSIHSPIYSPDPMSNFAGPAGPDDGLPQLPPPPAPVLKHAPGHIRNETKRELGTGRRGVSRFYLLGRFVRPGDARPGGHSRCEEQPVRRHLGGIGRSVDGWAIGGASAVPMDDYILFSQTDTGLTTDETDAQALSLGSTTLFGLKSLQTGTIDVTLDYEYLIESMIGGRTAWVEFAVGFYVDEGFGPYEQDDLLLEEQNGWRRTNAEDLLSSEFGDPSPNSWPLAILAKRFELSGAGMIEEDLSDVWQVDVTAGEHYSALVFVWSDPSAVPEPGATVVAWVAAAWLVAACRRRD